MSDSLAEVVGALDAGRDFLVLSHANPDADAVGSTMAMTLALRRKGKNAVAYNRDPAPFFVRYLPELSTLTSQPPDASAFDTLIVLDCGDFDRVGKDVVVRLQSHPNVINIDHHASNPMFGRLNLVDEGACSSCEMVHRILTKWSYDFDAATATCVYTGVYADTRAFHNANSTPSAFAVCAAMTAAGANPALVAQHLYEEQRPEVVRLLALALPTLRIENDGRLAGIVVTAEMMDAVGAGQDALEGFVDIPRSIIGVEAAYLVREVVSSDGVCRVKGSVRTSEIIDATVVTGAFGGGGHRRAAGFTTDGSLEEVRARLVERLREQLAAS